MERNKTGSFDKIVSKHPKKHPYGYFSDAYDDFICFVTSLAKLCDFICMFVQ